MHIKQVFIDSIRFWAESAHVVHVDLKHTETGGRQTQSRAGPFDRLRAVHGFRQQTVEI
jgi:hypothetical protein